MLLNLHQQKSYKTLLLLKETKPSYNLKKILEIAMKPVHSHLKNIEEKISNKADLMKTPSNKNKNQYESDLQTSRMEEYLEKDLLNDLAIIEQRLSTRDFS